MADGGTLRLVGHSISDPAGNYPRRVMFADHAEALAEAQARDARDGLGEFDRRHEVCDVYADASGGLRFTFDPAGPDA